MFHNPFKTIRELKAELDSTYRILEIKERRIVELEAELQSGSHRVKVSCVGCKNLVEWETDTYGYNRTEFGCKLNNRCSDREEKNDWKEIDRCKNIGGSEPEKIEATTLDINAPVMYRRNEYETVINNG